MKRTQRKPSSRHTRSNLQQAISNSKRSHLSTKAPLTVSRTVEMVNQKGEDWRCSKSQLLFMTGLGLTPVEGWNGMTPFTLNISFVPNDDSKKRFASSKTDSTAVTSSDSGFSSEESNVSYHSDLNNDHDCVCTGVFNFQTLPGYPNIKIAALQAEK